MAAVKVVIGTCSYKGPDVHCFRNHYEFLFRLGRIQEASQAGRMDQALGLRDGDPAFQFYLADETGNSLIGQARDRIIEQALTLQADYLLFFDDDMILPPGVFLDLWRHRVPMVGALAFTAREPISPVLYQFRRTWDFKKQNDNVDIQPLAYYEKDALMRVDAIGTGVVLIDLHQTIEKMDPPWFHGAVSAGEDIHFCWKLYQAGIPVHCDTAVKTLHKPNEPAVWMGEEHYLERRRNLERQAATDDCGADVRELQATG